MHSHFLHYRFKHNLYLDTVETIIEVALSYKCHKADVSTSLLRKDINVYMRRVMISVKFI